MVLRDRDKHGGGLAMYIKEDIPFVVLLKHPTSEVLLLELKLRNQNLLCGVFYRPPSSNSVPLVELESALESVPPSKLRNTLLAGGFFHSPPVSGART